MNSSGFAKIFFPLGVLLFVFLILLPISLAADGAGAYGSNCTVDLDCNQSIGLACNKTECDCARPSEMKYDKTKQACIVFESFSCEKTPQLNATEFGCTKRSACVSVPGPNATESKICKCEAGYSATHEHSCNGDFGTNCDEDQNQCNHFALLVCEMAKGEPVGKCGCYEPHENVYENSKCVALAGGKCAIHKPPYVLDCVKNATCILQESQTTKNTTGICQCDKGFTKLSSGRCGSGSGVSSVISSSLLILVAMLITQFSGVKS